MYEVIPDSAFNWKLVNKTTGRIVLEGATRNKCIEIKRNLELNREKRSNSMAGGQ